LILCFNNKKTKTKFLGQHTEGGPRPLPWVEIYFPADASV
jgi:hypothetical protein